MPFPSIAATNSGSSGGNATSHTVNLPAGIVAGNLLLVAFTNDGSATVSVTTPATGWSTLYSTPNGSNARSTVFYRFADGSEGSTITVTTSASEGSAHASWRMTGVDKQTNPEGGTPATGSSANPNPPSLNPSNWGTEDTLWIAVYGWDGNVAHTSYPANYTLGQTTNRWANANGCGVAIGGRQLNAASEDPGTATIGSEDWIANTIAVRGQVAATADVTTGGLDFAGSATFVPLATFTATATLTFGGLDFAGSASLTLPAVYTASLAHTLGGATFAASGLASAPHPVGRITQPRHGLSGAAYDGFAGKDTTPPVSIGDITGLLGGVEFAGLASSSAPHPVARLTQSHYGLSGRLYSSFADKGADYSGSAALLLPHVTFAASATFSPPVFSSSDTITLGAITFTAAAAFTAPVYTASAAVQLGHVSLGGAAANTPPSYTATAALTLGPATFTGSALFAAAIYQASEASALGPLAFAASGTVTSPSYTATLAATLGPPQIASTGIVQAPEYEGSASVTLAGLTLSGSATFAPQTSHTASATLTLGAVAYAGIEAGAVVVADHHCGAVTVRPAYHARVGTHPAHTANISLQPAYEASTQIHECVVR